MTPLERAHEVSRRMDEKDRYWVDEIEDAIRKAEAAARAAGYRAGQEAMREHWHDAAQASGASPSVLAAIRALPLTEEVADGR